MKKTLCLVLALVMALSLSSAAFAVEGAIDHENPQVDDAAHTIVKYTGEEEEQWSLTVPAELAPGGEGDVTLSGNWSPATTVVVGIDGSVDMSSAGIQDTKQLVVNFEENTVVTNEKESTAGAIWLRGSLEDAVSFTTLVQVDNWAEGEAPRFGVWTGTITYDVVFNKNN